eukprot:TRINITY_DN3476_c0_g1_i1.p3 TRINITY_DN3476_c0_g1~~TRINITY_DN3476_c0_g1_i1.p3  ORF type:complete len:50 (+),score=15.19 TRINITY_DN3476_c0_g1_i1:210-359(+)
MKNPAKENEDVQQIVDGKQPGPICVGAQLCVSRKYMGFRKFRELFRYDD